MALSYNKCLTLEFQFNWKRNLLHFDTLNKHHIKIFSWHLLDCVPGICFPLKKKIAFFKPLTPI